MTIPNLLTLSRILLVPVLVVILMTRVQHHQILGALVFWVASITDFFDGYLARRWKQVTVLGKLLDPLADKLLISAALISLIELNMIPAWMVFVILSREMAITGLRGLASEEGITIAADSIGKWKLGAQITAISCLIFGPVLDRWLLMWTGGGIFHSWSVAEFFKGALRNPKPWGLFVGLGQIILWISLFLALWSAVIYFRNFWNRLGERILKGEGRLAKSEKSLDGEDEGSPSR